MSAALYQPADIHPWAYEIRPRLQFVVEWSRLEHLKRSLFRRNALSQSSSASELIRLCAARCRQKEKEVFLFHEVLEITESKHCFRFDWVHCLGFSSTAPCGVSCASNLYSLLGLSIICFSFSLLSTSNRLALSYVSLHTLSFQRSWDLYLQHSRSKD